MFFGQFCSNDARQVSISPVDLTPATFQQALDEYRLRVGGRRVRTIKFQYVSSCEVLQKKIESHFNTSFDGGSAKFDYLGISMVVSMVGRDIFLLCESY